MSYPMQRGWGKAKRLTWSDRLWIRWHSRHGPVDVNTTITVPMFDPSARGVLLSCDCGAVRAR